MKTNFGLQNMQKAVKDAKEGKINILHYNTEFSNYCAIPKEIIEAQNKK